MGFSLEDNDMQEKASPPSYQNDLQKYYSELYR